MVRWAGHVASMGEMRNTNKYLVEKPERRRPLRKARHKCEDNIKMDVKFDNVIMRL
jgi:hypothetical protein